MRYILITINLFFVMGCQSEVWTFDPSFNYVDSYLNSTAHYVRMLDGWDCNTQGAPPPPQPPQQIHTGRFPSPRFRGSGVGSSFMQGYADGTAAGAQAGAIQLQAARNEAYNIALNHYYSVLSHSRSSMIKIQD